MGRPTWQKSLYSTEGANRLNLAVASDVTVEAARDAAEFARYVDSYLPSGNHAV
ncbi:hypothetical protein [Streptomyces beigongshangae]|uniref:hypothetical protein n=1 Tax=Streptomyces beigongshangae TaxID=2841597 RepID=UPI001C860DF0|nr:hypothetical protein [Streptomyces sp. REN17]